MITQQDTAEKNHRSRAAESIRFLRNHVDSADGGNFLRKFSFIAGFRLYSQIIENFQKLKICMTIIELEK